MIRDLLNDVRCIEQEIVQVKKRCFKAKLAAFLGQKLNSPIMDCLFHIGRKLVLQYFLLS